MYSKKLSWNLQTPICVVQDYHIPTKFNLYAMDADLAVEKDPNKRPLPYIHDPRACIGFVMVKTFANRYDGGRNDRTEAAKTQGFAQVCLNADMHQYDLYLEGLEEGGIDPVCKQVATMQYDTIKYQNPNFLSLLKGFYSLFCWYGFKPCQLHGQDFGQTIGFDASLFRFWVYLNSNLLSPIGSSHLGLIDKERAKFEKIYE